MKVSVCNFNASRICQAVKTAAKSRNHRFDSCMRSCWRFSWTESSPLNVQASVLEARLRDREFDETKRELNKWLNRLAKRVLVTDILVKLSGGGRTLVLDDPEPYSQMTEPFSWWKESGGKPAWVEYLLWESAPGTRYPLKLMYKYYEDPEISAELARRLAWERGIVTPPESREDQKACGVSTDVVQ